MATPFRRLGIAFVISGPSGTGKTSLCHKMLESDIDIRFSVSCTTRPPRPDEVDGRDYYFVTRDEFTERIEHGDFIEYAEVHGNLYGTLRSEVQSHVQHGKDVFLDIDIQGANQVQNDINDEQWKQCAQYIFVGPPSMTELESRLRARGTETDDIIARRLTNAQLELANWRNYDYLVINHTLEQAIRDLTAIFVAERQRASRILVDNPWTP